MDPMMFKALGEEHLDELRREAAAHRAARYARRTEAPVSRWRRTTGGLLVSAGRRMLGGAATVVVIRAPE